MKTTTFCLLAIVVCLGLAGPAAAGPSLPVTKPPVTPVGLLTGPPIDPAATNGQWFSNLGGTESVRPYEFYDNAAGGPAGINAISGYVDSITYMAGPGTPILRFTVQATIFNDTTLEAGWGPSDNRHGETNSYQGTPYVGSLQDTKLAAEFAIADTNLLPLAFVGPYRATSPYIVATNEDQRAWYCWNPDDQDPAHKPPGGYFVPTWDFGDIPVGQTARRQLGFMVPPPGLQPADARYIAIVTSYGTSSDVLMNRTYSLKISTWIDDIALDAAQQEPPPLRLSDVSVFHNKETLLDFGDAPDAPYPTLLANDGARHVILPGFCLGALIDAEADGQQSAQADGDDLNPLVLDDEDGVTFATALFPGVQSRVQVVAIVPPATSAYVSVWIDLDGDGTWQHPAERVVADNGAVTGTQWYNFTPGAIAAQSSTYARVRISSQMGLGPTGLANDGEVEDYKIPIAPVKWLQEPDLTSTGVDVDNSQVRLADDFQCTESGPITDIHIWTSFYYDATPPEGLTTIPIALYLYTDVPVGPQNPYSHPGNLVWSRTFAPGTYAAGRISAGPSEWWHNPVQDSWEFPGDSQVFQYDFTISEQEAFVQTNGTTYWLGVKYTEGQGWRMGWKSSTNHWNDDACWFDGDSWHELRYGGEHPLTNDSMDLSFAVTGIPLAEPTLDFGDAPDTPYPTRLANDGARHTVTPGVYLGAQIDAEADGQPNATATGDDLANLDDEDGVAFLTPLVAGQSATATVSCSTSGLLFAWVDFNANGSWGDFGETQHSGTVMTQGMNYININVPVGATPTNTFARFRFTTLPVALGYIGLADNGEVEDYPVDIYAAGAGPTLDFGDAMDSLMIPSYPTLLANNGARHTVVPGVFLGASVDREPDGQPTFSADGDDINPPAGIDDEDGVVLPAELVAGSTAQVQVVASVPGFLNAWIDWNANNSWAQPGEQVFSNQPLSAGVNLLALPVPLPPTLVAGGPPSRWRFTTYLPPVPAYTNLEMDGEVEDHEVQLEILDFGDAPDPSYPTLQASDGARHRIPSAYYLGLTAPDIDPDGQPTSDADGDDNAGTDDEDGVAVSGFLVQGRAGAVNVQVSAGGFLNAWFDFNADGDWTDPDNYVATNVGLVAGVTSVNLTIPADAQVGPVITRFRFNSIGSLAPTGFASDGEVEDHVFTIYQAGPTNPAGFEITNIVVEMTNNTYTLLWAGETNVTYETQYRTNLVSPAAPPWTAWGAYVTGQPWRQADTNAVDTNKFYRVVAPYILPPP